MPYLRVELHLWWLEWIVWWNVDVHVEDASLVASVFLLNGITRSIKEFIRTEIGPIGQKSLHDLQVRRFFLSSV